MKTCSVEGCNRKSEKRGFCGMHYQRWWKHGDPCYQKEVYKKCIIEGCNNETRSKYSPYCEKHYYRLRRNGNSNLNIDMGKYDYCLHCGTKLEKPGKFCSGRCAARYYRGNDYKLKCPICGKEYIPNNRGIDRKTCSRECEIKRNRIRDNEYFKERFKNDEKFRQKVREYEYKKKARIHETQFEPINRDSIFERDEWVCKICGEKIDKKVKWPDPLFGTLDHVVPLSKGGTHTKDNLQAAHLICNIKKGANVKG